MKTDYSALSKQKLLDKIDAQQKTIDVLMDNTEERAGKGFTSLSLLSENLHLEKIVEHKTEILQKQGKKLAKTLEELQSTQAQLLQANKLESVGRLAAGIAHEINTPAQFVGTNIEFFRETFEKIQSFMQDLSHHIKRLEQGNCSEVQKRIANSLKELDWEYLDEEVPLAIEQSQDGVKRISSIVLAMKEFTHPSNKSMESHNVNTIIDRTIIVSRNEWKYCASLETDFDPNLPKIECLVDELGQVFLNMIVNAAHAITDKNRDDEEKLGDIKISTRFKAPNIVITIKDTGNGIPDTIKSKIFDPFFTTKGVGLGTGQGLTIAHDIVVNKHNGKLLCNSTAGEGTEFQITLPLIQSA